MFRNFFLISLFLITAENSSPQVIEWLEHGCDPLCERQQSPRYIEADHCAPPSANPDEHTSARLVALIDVLQQAYDAGASAEELSVLADLALGAGEDWTTHLAIQSVRQAALEAVLRQPIATTREACPSVTL